jgi:hypothetical protein
MTIAAGKRLTATDLVLPAVVTGYGAGTNTITATTFAVLPTNTCSAAITNTHPTASLRVLVTYGAWMSASANGVRGSLAITGSLTIAAGIGTAAIGWGEIPYTDSTAGNAVRSGSFTLDLPVSASACTFSWQAYRDAAAGTQTCNYPTIRILPINFIF